MKHYRNKQFVHLSSRSPTLMTKALLKIVSKGVEENFLMLKLIDDGLIIYEEFPSLLQTEI